MNVKTTCWIIWLTALTGFSSCTSFLKFSALPDQEVTSNEEFKYIHETDQRDRRQNLLRFIFLSEEKMYGNEKIIAVSDRDSIRLNRVIEMRRQGLVKAESDKYYAAYTYFHGGGLKMTNDTMYFRVAYELFKDLKEAMPVYTGRGTNGAGWKQNLVPKLEERI